ncbi:MAG TPA: hypothetical protein VF628_07155 [Allosphingosinicella sp.]
MTMRRTGLLLLILALGACVPRSEPPAPQPRPQPPVQTQPRPQPPAPPAPAPADWRDMALTPGGWTYRSGGDTSEAMFGAGAGQAGFIVRCERSRRQVSLWRAGVTSGNVMTVRSSYGARNLPLSVQARPEFVFTTLPAGDRLLDELAYSRGRYTIEVPGTPMLVIPSWPEPARVVEDCRG